MATRESYLTSTIEDAGTIFGVEQVPQSIGHAASSVTPAAPRNLAQSLHGTVVFSVVIRMNLNFLRLN